MLTERIEDTNRHECSENMPTQPSEESLEALSTVPSTEEGVAEASRPATPPLVNNLMEMGFTRPQINVALERYAPQCMQIFRLYIPSLKSVLTRCEVPPDSTEEVRTQLIVNWIFEHPNAVSEEEVSLLDNSMIFYIIYKKPDSLFSPLVFSQ